MILKNCTSQDFIKELNGRKVICFGAGTTLMDAEYDFYKIDNLEDHIAYFVDNDPKKHGLPFCYNGKSFDIKSPDTLKEIDLNKFVLLVTCDYYFEIYDQLKDIPQLADLHFYIYFMICIASDVDIDRFFTKETQKPQFKNWRQVLSALNLKDRHKDQRCFVIGNGPSLTVDDLNLLKNEVSFAANGIYLLFDKTDWRPTYYFCADLYEYRFTYKTINNIDSKMKFLPRNYALLAGEVFDDITYYNKASASSCVTDSEIVRSVYFDFSENPEDVICSGLTVLYDALQIAVYMGFSEIYLIGVDCNYKKELLEDGRIVENDVPADHFTPEYDEPFKDISSSGAPLFAMRQAFKTVAAVCARRGILIKNATRGGKLDAFERISLEDVLAD